VPEPVLVGVLDDMGGDASEVASTGRMALVRAPVDDAIERGRIDRPVDYVHASCLGLPQGTARAVEQAFADLVERGVLCIIGPAIGDDALVATPLADRFAVPTINWAGTERGRSEYMFHLQVGSHEDEAIVIARFLTDQGHHRVGVVYDRSPIGRRYLQFFLAECERVGVAVATTVAVAPTSTVASGEVATVLEASVDAMVYLGLGLAVPHVAAALAGTGSDIDRVMNTAGMRGASPDFAALIDGWRYVDVYSDQNRTLADVRRRFSLGPQSGPFGALAYDLGQLVAEGIARAPEMTRAGIKEGLELIKWIPAAEGKDGTLLGFGHYDRGALHGAYLVLRRWQHGRSVEV
jgi:branched-chain amino acid transport system substrate-binding protein